MSRIGTAARAPRWAAAASAAAALALAAGCGGGGSGSDAAGAAPEGPDISAADAVVRAPANPGVAAGYLTLTNGGGTGAELTGAATDAADSVEIHDTVESGGTTTMEEQDSVPVPAGERVDFEPGGLHLMLMEPDSLEAGDQLDLTLEFSGADPLTVTAQVVEPGGGPESHGEHGGHG
ncbi:copper chaperone PCu(A)C [Nocardiopsis coralliicola]